MDRGYADLVRRTVETLLLDLPEGEREKVRENIKGKGLRTALDIVSKAAMAGYHDPEWLRDDC
jgi:hypothetical protein